MIRPDVLGAIDIASGILLFYTFSPVPGLFADVHAGFLIFKGLISQMKIGAPVMPIYTIGIAADMISAAILYVGNPPVLGEFKMILAGALFLKGLWSLMFKFAG